MGWTSYYRAPGQSDREHLQHELFTRWGSDGPRHEIVDCTTVRGTFYAAVRDINTGEVWGLVVLQRRMRGEHNYARKEIDEFMGPAEDRCPDRILDLLSPTEKEWAVQWRERCRVNNRRQRTCPKVRRGDTVTFPEGLRFGDGVTTDVFRFVERTTFARVCDSRLVRIPSWKDRSFLVQPA